MMIFVFSNDHAWVKENFLFDVPTMLVEGVERDVDEMFLMSQCKHNIIANSTFSWWSAWLNPNPDKKIFAPKTWLRNLHGNADIVPESWIKMPVDFNQYPNSEIGRELSIVIYVKNNLRTLGICLASVFMQTKTGYEVIIIDDASRDGSRQFCRLESERHANARFIALKREIGKSAAFNLGIARARNRYVLLLDADKCILANAVEVIANLADIGDADVWHFVKYLQADDGGGIALAGRKFSVRTELAIQNFNIGAKVFRCNFLIENFIRFNEDVDDFTAERAFIAECMQKTQRQLLGEYPYLVM